MGFGFGCECSILGGVGVVGSLDEVFFVGFCFRGKFLFFGRLGISVVVFVG